MSSIPQPFLQDVWIRKTLGLVGYSSLVYDHFLTFDREVEFIWRSPWTVTKTIFLVNRYGNLLGQTYLQVLDTGWVVHGAASLELCQVYNLFSALFMFFSAESIHIIVLLRAWAIWGCRRRVAAALIGSYLLYLLFTVVMTCLGTSSPTCGYHLLFLFGFAAEIAIMACSLVTFALVHEFQYLDLIGICVGIIPQFIWFLPVASFVLDTVVFGTTMRSLWQHSRECRRLYPSPLLQLLVRDAAIFYVVSAFNNAFTAITWTVYSTSPKYSLSLTLSLNLLCIAGQRLVLNLRGLTTRSYGPRSLSAEVDRQIGRINDASPTWWSSNGKFDRRDDMGCGYGSLGDDDNENNMLRGRDVEMVTLEPRVYGLSSKVGPTAGMSRVPVDAVTEMLQPSDEVHAPPCRSHTTRSLLDDRTVNSASGTVS